MSAALLLAASVATLGGSSEITKRTFVKFLPVLESASDLQARVHEPGARVTLVHFWAHWCTPCREEWPELAREMKSWEKKGVRIVTISLDPPEQAEKARDFLRRVHAPLERAYLLDVADPGASMELLSADWAGELPATFVFAGRERVLQQLGKTNARVLEAALTRALSTGAKTR